jgi:hypothetical protein
MKMPSKEEVKKGAIFAAIIVAIVALFNHFRSAQ